MQARSVGTTPPLKIEAPRTRPTTSAEAEPVVVSDQFSPGQTRAPGRPTFAAAAPPAPPPEADPPDLNLGDPQQSSQRIRAAFDKDQVAQLRQKRKDLRAEIKELPRSAPLRQAAELHKNMLETQGSLKRIERVQREVRWDAIESEHQGRQPSPTYKGYFVNGTVPIKQMKEVLQVADELADPNSARRLKGNEIDVLTRGEIWKTKMEMMERAATQPTENGKPLNVDAEYFELSSPEALDKLSRSARGGARVRVLVDSGRLQPDGENQDATSLASRLNTVRSLDAQSKGKAGVQFFANKDVLGARGELMHRKLLRVGDEVLFGGMNANDGSGENVDSGMTMRGPAARKQAEGFQADLDRSTGKSVEEIFGNQLQDLREKENISVGSHGLLHLTEAAGAQGTRAGRTREQRIDAALESAAYQGITPSQLAEIPDSDGDGKVTAADEKAFLMNGSGSIRLTAQGREFLASGLEQAVAKMNAEPNQRRLKAGELPSDRQVGTDTVAIGDSSSERQAMILHAIDSAERRVDVSAFVMSEELARVLADKKDRMTAEGKPFDVRVVMDPGIYQYGGTPNEKGYRLLEERGVPVKWAVLDRTEPHHDRKVHAKLMVTDKMMLTGSTNFSSKGMRDNWELSDVVYFGEDDKSQAKQAELHSDFDQLWNREAVGINTMELAQQRYSRQTEGPEKDYLVDKYRGRVMRGFLRGIDNYEKEIGGRIQQEVQTNPDLAFNLEQRVKNGQARGYALMDLLGPERLATLRQSSSAYQGLQTLAQEGI